MARLRCSLGNGGGRDGGAPAGSPHRDGLAGTWLEVLQCFRRGHPRLSLRLPKIALAALALLAIAGCGDGEGAADGATVTAYVAASLCAEADRELAKHGGEAGDLHVRAVCLPSAESSRKLNLARIGVNARQATEDASAIAYIGEPTRAASRFSKPILEAADIPQLPQSSGAKAMAELLQALEQASGDSGSLRQSINDELS
jgi:hypothetical protein